MYLQWLGFMLMQQHVTRSRFNTTIVSFSIVLEHLYPLAPYTRIVKMKADVVLAENAIEGRLLEIQ